MQVLKEGTLPLQAPNTKTFRSTEQITSVSGFSVLPVITPRGGAEHVGGAVSSSRLATPISVQNSVAPSTPDSTHLNLKQAQDTTRVQQATLRSFVVEVQALEKECAHWRDVVDKKHQDLRATNRALEEEKRAHFESKHQAKDRARERDASARISVESLVEELAGMLELLEDEIGSMQQMQVKAIVNGASSRGNTKTLCKLLPGGRVGL